jgi:HK97 family phage prohead protease
MITPNREYRAFEFQSDDEKMIVEGQAVTFENRTMMYEIDGIKFYEKISARAFDNTKMDDTILNVDHQGKPAAKTKNGTLELTKTEQGLFIRADLSKNATGRELYEDVKNGFYDKMSFAFTVRKDEYDKATRTRNILDIDRLYDTSIVTYPAYESTSIMARSFFDTEVEKERMEMRMRDMKVKKLKLLLDLTKGD